MPQTTDASGPDEELQRRVLDLTRALWQEIDPRAATAGLDAHTSLQREIGLDSLARAELLLRVERALDRRLPAGALAEIDCVHDIVQRLRGAAPGAAPATARAATFERVPEASPRHVRTLPELLQWHVRMHAERVQLVLLSEAGEQPLRYAQLQQGASRVAAWLQRRGVEPGQAVALMLPTCMAYFPAYLGILLAGAVPIPIYPPARPQEVEDHVRRHAAILDNAQAVLLLGTPQLMPVARLLRALVPSLRGVADVQDGLRGPQRAARPVPVEPGDTAFIQYTSGSTGAPKGVVLSHANLLANIRAIGQVAGLRDDDVFVSWLPLYHDMGLIAAWLASLYHARPLVLLSPTDFLQRPQAWLWAIHRWRGTLSAAPNFAFELCLRHTDEAALRGLDLGSLRLLVSGAEPVRAATLERFAERFARYGLRRQALTPAYGLAECTVGLLVSPTGRGPRIDSIRREPFVRERRAEPDAAGEPHALRFVSCGQPLPGHEVRLVDAQGREVGERIEGMLQFRGPSATAGYWRNPERTRELQRGDGWLDSGDLAYRADGEYFLTGRAKDLIIRGGRHLDPEEIEDVVAEVPGLHAGRVVAFGVSDPRSGTERLVIAAEVPGLDPAMRAAVHARMAERLAGRLGEGADEVLLLPAGSVLKTPSGKQRRAAMRELYLGGGLGRPPPGARWQLARLGAAALVARARRAAGAAAAWAWAGRAWIAFGALLPLLLAGVALQPDTTRAWRWAHRVARAMLRLAGVPLLVGGSWPRRAVVAVANHASYADALVLLAAVPQPLRFVGKRELQRHRLFAYVLRRLGVVFVERLSAQHSVDDARQLLACARGGDTLCVFAEGTFRRAPGLLGFHLGAFETAARAGLPVLPLGLRGTRELLPDGSWRPRRGAVELRIGEVLEEAVANDAFATAAQLLRSCRAALLRLSGEPDAGHPIAGVGVVDGEQCKQV